MKRLIVEYRSWQENDYTSTYEGTMKLPVDEIVVKLPLVRIDISPYISDYIRTLLDMIGSQQITVDVPLPNVIATVEDVTTDNVLEIVRSVYLSTVEQRTELAIAIIEALETNTLNAIVLRKLVGSLNL